MRKEISRREFLELGGAASTLWLMLLGCAQLKETIVSDPEVILDQLEQETGANVLRGDQYDALFARTQRYDLHQTNLPEAETIAAAVRQCPNPRLLLPVIIPVQENQEQGQSRLGGSYIADAGQWLQMFIPSIEQETVNAAPFNTAMVLLEFPPALDLQSPVNQAEYNQDAFESLKFRSVIPPEATVTNNILTAPIPATKKDRLTHILLHESGHALLDIFRARMAESPEHYAQLNEMYYLGFQRPAQGHPLLDAFASANGWQLQRYGDWLQVVAPEVDYDNPAINVTPEELERQIYVRDPQVWGTVAERQVRVSVYGDFNTIEEAFCEYWRSAIMNQGSLNQAEQLLFDKIINGIASDPIAFIDDVIADPQQLIE